MSVEATMPMSGIVGSAAARPAQSQSTDMRRITLMKQMRFPKWSHVALADSDMVSMRSSLPGH